MSAFRVSEIFGPTIQGEGRHAGIPCYFIRFAGCDYRCSWCDSPHAVLPELVATVPRKTEEDIVRELESLPTGPRWVVLSGGNPALFDLGRLNTILHAYDYQVMMETQGTVYKDWIEKVDEVCVSPKPPSSGNPTSVDTLATFMTHDSGQMYLKVVVFNDEDYMYARDIRRKFRWYDMFLSVGNLSSDLPTVANPKTLPSHRPNIAREAVLQKMVPLMERVASDYVMSNVRVLPQLHVLAWGNKRGT